jgi:hypothetical protein
MFPESTETSVIKLSTPQWSLVGFLGFVGIQNASQLQNELSQCWSGKLVGLTTL